MSKKPKNEKPPGLTEDNEQGWHVKPQKAENYWNIVPTLPADVCRKYLFSEKDVKQ